MKKERRYVSINEAAALCGVCRRTIYNWMEQGFLGEMIRTPSGAVRIDKQLLLTRSKYRRQPFVNNLPQHGIQSD
jgi:predicted DNA-binding transcriptional regulator AlpA